MKTLGLIFTLGILVSCGGNQVLVPNCLPQPVADAGEDKIIVKGLAMSDRVQLGSPGVEGSQYIWMPAEGLDNPHVPQPIATVKGSMVYQLSVTNKCGLAQDSVSVDLYEE